MLATIALPPGVVRLGTELLSQGRFYTADKVRWFQGVLRPIGGWRKRFNSQTALTGDCRALLVWRENGGTRWIALGTHTPHLYVMSDSGTVTDITPAGMTAGTADAAVPTGYGRGLYGRGTYGTPRPDTGTVLPASTWSLDYWGENLVACFDADGDLLEWTLNTANDAAVITNAPTGCSALLVTPERFLVGFKGREVIWSDQEDNTVWTPSSTNQAGDFTLATAGNIQCGLKLAQGFLVLTDADAWQATYLDATYVYGFRRVGEGCGAISRKAAVSTDTKAVWMGDNAFYAYQGGYAEAIECDVADYVFANLNTGQKSKCFAQHRAEYGEVWFHYPSIASTEVDSYVIFNYRENTWSLGTMDRTAACDVGARFAYPLAVSSTGYVYEHEVGQTYDGDDTWSAETGPFRLGLGDRMMELQRLIPDEKTAGDAVVYVYTKQWPNGAETQHGPYDAANPIDLLIQAAQIRFRYEGARMADARIGGWRADMIKGDPLL